MSKRTITMPGAGHLFKVGDVVELSGHPGRTKRLLQLLTKPRLTCVTSVEHHTLEIQERRMTWREWRSAFWRSLF